MLAAFSYGLQQTMVLPALPYLQDDLHTTTTWSTWIFTGFLLSSAVLTPPIGKLGDQHGKERLLMISLLRLCFGAMAKLVVDAVPPSETGVASGLNTVMRTIGGVVGGQLGATVLANNTISGTSVPTGSAYSTAFWLDAVIAVCGVVTALAVAPLRRRP